VGKPSSFSVSGATTSRGAILASSARKRAASSVCVAENSPVEMSTQARPYAPAESLGSIATPAAARSSTKIAAR
jgi:hypothetical protein